MGEIIAVCDGCGQYVHDSFEYEHEECNEK